MNKQKGFAHILLILLGLAVIGGGTYVNDQKNDSGIFSKKEVAENSLPVVDDVNVKEDIVEDKKLNTTKENVKIDDKETVSSEIKTDQIIKEKVPEEINNLWGLFDKVTLALKNKDISLFNMYSYTQVKKEEESQFLDFAPYFHETNMKVKKDEYVNLWVDDKQAIFATEVKKVDDNYLLEKIIFVKQSDSWKLLTLSSGYFLDEGNKDLLIDSDKDGLLDAEENCTANRNPSCVKTDPNKRDTNGDGWWDGVDENMSL